MIHIFSVSRKNCYIVSAGDLQHRYGQQEESGKRMTPGLLIGCHVDTSTGVLSFTVNGNEVANKFQVRCHSKTDNAECYCLCCYKYDQETF